MTSPTDPATPHRTPRWVKVFAIVGVILVVLLILVLKGVFGEGHGPGRHLGDRSRPAANIGAPADAAGAAEHARMMSH